MPRWSLLAIVLLLGCGEDAAAPVPAPAPEAPAPEVPVAEGPTPAPASPTPPATPPPTREAIEEAREQCNRGYGALGEGDLDTARQEITPALAVLRRVTEAADRAILGACLYNAARLEEESLVIQLARDLYDESIQARPNPIAARRRRELGERATDAEDDRSEMVANQLRRATEANPCPSCDVETLAYAHSGGGRLLRAAVVAVRSRDDEDATPSLHLGFSGPRGAFRWGPPIWNPTPDAAIDWGDGPLVWLAFRHARLDRPWLLFVRVGNDWQERCCGMSADGFDEDLVICELTDDDARCVRVAELRQCEGELTDDTDPDAEACHYDRRRWVTFDPDGLEVHGEAGPEQVGDADRVAIGRHAWDELFPPPPEAPADAPEGE